MQAITTYLWFDDEAEEAANYYVSVFPNSRITRVQHYPEAAVDVSGKTAGSVMSVEFELNGAPWAALNGGPQEGFVFTPATSFLIPCEDQAEVDRFWAALSADPESEQCGWCRDRFGLSWQVAPAMLDDLLSDAAIAEKVTPVFLQMKKIEIAPLLAAAEA